MGGSVERPAVSRSSTRHALFPAGVEALAVIAWALVFGGLWMLAEGLQEGPVPGGGAISAVAIALSVFGAPLLVGLVIGWGISDPDYSTTVGKVAALRGGGLVLPRVGGVSMVVCFFLGLFGGGFVVGVLYGFLGFFLSVIGGLVGRRARA